MSGEPAHAGASRRRRRHLADTHAGAVTIGAIAHRGKVALAGQGEQVVPPATDDLGIDEPVPVDPWVLLRHSAPASELFRETEFAEGVLQPGGDLVADLVPRHAVAGGPGGVL